MCHSYRLDKHVRLPFVHSQFISTRPIEIIHSNLWISPVSSPSGYKYYVLFLDILTSCRLPHYFANLMFMIYIVKFNAYVNTQFELQIKSFQCDHGVNSTINYSINFAIIGVFIFVFLVLTHLHKMKNPKEKFVQLIILFARYYVMLLFPRTFGFTP